MASRHSATFTGGAKIGQQNDANAFGWTTADPVTGTYAGFAFASYGNNVYTAETEPFGQDVAMSDPYYQPPEPPANVPAHEVSFKEASIWSVVWVSLARL